MLKTQKKSLEIPVKIPKGVQISDLTIVIKITGKKKKPRK